MYRAQVTQCLGLYGFSSEQARALLKRYAPLVDAAERRGRNPHSMATEIWEIEDAAAA